MPIPLGVVAAESAAGIVSGALAGVASRLLTKPFDPAILLATFTANRDSSFEVPPVGALIDALVKGRSRVDIINKGLRKHGIPLQSDSGKPESQEARAIWEEVWKGLLPYPQMADFAHLWHRGRITDETFMQQFKKTGGYNEIAPYLLRMTEGKFDFTMLAELWFRGMITDDVFRAELRSTMGIGRMNYKDIQESFKFIPGPADLVHFAIRDVWRPDIIKQLGLDKEYEENENMRTWFGARGIGNVTVYDEEDNPVTMDMAKAYWIAHWVMMSPTQAYQAKFMLRPGRLWKWGEGIKDLNTFDQTTLENLLRASDYVPEQRKWLTAISHRVLQFRQARQLFDKDIIDRDEMKETMLDQGYVSIDAENLTKLYEKLKKEAKDKDDEKRQERRQRKYVQEIEKAYEVGSISKAQASVALLNTYLEPDDVSAMLDAIDIARNVALVKMYIKMVKDEFFLGNYDGVAALIQLTQAGVEQVRATQYVQLWQRQLSRPRRITSTNEIVEWFRRGFITESNALFRLHNLGWSNEDQLLWIAAGRLKVSQDLERAAAQQARTERQQVEAAERLQRRAEAETRAAVSESYKYSSPAMLKKWYKDGLIDLDYVAGNLRFKQWPEENIALFIADLEQSNGAITNGQPNPT